MDFRFPHPFENIGDAIKDAVNPDTTADGSFPAQLMNENNRAIEDALAGIVPGTTIVTSGNTATDTGDPASCVFSPATRGLAIVSVSMVPDLTGYDPMTQAPIIYVLNAVIAGSGPFPKSIEFHQTSSSTYLQGVLLLLSTGGVIACGAGCGSNTPGSGDVTYPVDADFKLDILEF